jgi:hypothetical protein
MKPSLLLTAAAFAALLITTAPRALAADTLCSTLVGPPSYNNPNPVAITGNLEVDLPNCELTGGGTVTGNVTVRSGNSLTLDHKWVIGGNLHANGCAFVNVNTHGPYFPGGISYTTSIGGSVVIQNCTGGLGIQWAFFNQPGTVIIGDFTCENNGAACFLVGATIGGTVKVLSNVYTPTSPMNANSSVTNNTIMNNLVCQGNSPTPLNGLGTNTVLGNNNQNSEGQCLGF